MIGAELAPVDRHVYTEPVGQPAGKGFNLPKLDAWHGWKSEEYSLLIRAVGSTQEDQDKSLRKPGDYPSALHRLPRELLDLILKDLDCESELSLRLSCRHLYLGCGADPVFSLIYKMRIHEASNVRFAWRLLPEWIPMLRHNPLAFPFCARCKVRHPREVFSEDDLVMLPTRRVCLGHRRKLHLSSNYMISYDDLQQLLTGQQIAVPIRNYRHGFFYNKHTSSEYRNDLMPTRCKTDSSIKEYSRMPHLHSATSQSGPDVIFWCADKSKKTFAMSPALYYEPKTNIGYHLRYYWRFWFEKSKSLVQALQLRADSRDRSVTRFCPHLRADDPRIAEAANTCCKRKLDPYERSSHISCILCKTGLRFVQDVDDPYLIVEVTRHLGNLESPANAQWLAHLE